MTTCFKCGKPIPKKKRSCPYCSARQPGKIGCLGAVGIAVGVLLLLFIILIIVVVSTAERTDPTEQPATTQTAETPQPEESTVAEPEPAPAPEQEPAPEPEPEPAHEPEPEQEPVEEKPSFDREACEEIDYKAFLRNPDDHLDTPVKATVKIVQIMDGGIFDRNTKYYRCYGYDAAQEYFPEDYDKEFLIYDQRGDGAIKLLDDDVIVVYGTFRGAEQVRRALTRTNDEVLTINMKDCDLLESDD
ncbi:MAG: hypothetical protein IJT18_02010 [Oscillospiraceae bacterium]|nr:hypothetical protein [Oscillospiraceae bacterium]